MSTPEVNIPLLRKAVEWAEAEAAKPAELCEWEQRYFVAPQDLHDSVLGDIGYGGWLKEYRATKAPECGTCYCVAGFVAAQGMAPWTYSTAEEVATASLGLSYEQADELFAAYNDIEDVRRIAEDIAGERL